MQWIIKFAIPSPDVMYAYIHYFVVRSNELENSCWQRFSILLVIKTEQGWESIPP